MATQQPSNRETADQQRLQSKARQSAGLGEDEEEEHFDDEPSVLQEWIKQSPAMLVSLVFHMFVFIGLAIYTFEALTNPGPVVKVMPEEEVIEEEEIKIAEEVVEDPPEEVINAPIPNEILEPVPETSEAVETDANDPEAASMLFEDFVPSDFAVPVKQGTSKSVAGSGTTGLGSRTGAKKGFGLRRGGGTPGSETAVGAGLKWLARHQNSNGSWSFNHTPGDKCSLFPNPGEKTSKMGATGLALLAFLGSGHTHQMSGPYQKTVRDGVAYLMSHMGGDGRLYESDGEHHTHMYCHGIAACAMAEAYGLTRDKKLQGPAQLALKYIVAAQHSGGGWRYQPGEPGDTSAVGWQIMAFKSGKMSYLSVPDHVYPNAMKFLDSVAEGGGSRYIYMPNHSIGDEGATSAIGLLCRTYMGWPKEHPGLKGGVSYVGGKGPHSDDMYFNYYATMFMFQNDGPRGPAWGKWNDVMRDQLTKTQETKGGIHRVGSWFFPNDNAHGEGTAGGRLYHTALATMTLQVYYRYGNAFDNKH